MGTKTKIAWTHHTANLWWGCTEVHEGCDHCYAKTFDKRVGGNHWGARSPRRPIKSIWKNVTDWQKAAMDKGERNYVFCGSMMDIFERSQPLALKDRLTGDETGTLRNRYFEEVIPATPNLFHLLLSKRPQNIKRFVPVDWFVRPPHNTAYGYSASTQASLEKGIEHLLGMPGFRFLSLEPLLDRIDISPYIYQHFSADDPRYLPRREGIDWVIIGGESGAGSRPCNPAWIEEIVDLCQKSGTAVFVKQMGGVWAKQMGAIDGKGEDMSEWPKRLQVQEWPKWKVCW